MVNNRGYILHKDPNKKDRRHDYDVYKRNRPVIPKQVVTIANLGYLGVEKDFPAQLSAIAVQKEEKSGSIERRKRVQQNSC